MVTTKSHDSSLHPRRALGWDTGFSLALLTQSPIGAACGQTATESVAPLFSTGATLGP